MQSKPKKQDNKGVHLFKEGVTTTLATLCPLFCRVREDRSRHRGYESGQVLGLLQA